MATAKHLIGAATVLSLVVVFIVLRTAFGAVTPSLGVAETYAVLADTFTNTSAATTINGDIGFSVGPAVVPLGTHTNYGSGDPTPAARVAAGDALAALALEGCTFTWAAAVDLSTDPTHGTVGEYAPGVYCSTGAMSITGPLLLVGDGTYIFRAVGALNSTASSIVTLSGASACDVFWTPTGATTLGASSTFAGTVIDNGNAITVGASTNWTGRALALGAGAVTTGATVTITAPDCTPPQAVLHVVKTVVNDDGGVSVAGDAVIHVTNGDGEVVGSPQAGEGDPGTSYTLAPGAYSVSEDAFVGYTQTFSGDCDADGNIVLASGDDLTCTITNNDIAPVIPPATITVVKTVVNDNEGVLTVSDFPLFVNGTPVVSGEANVFAAPASYTVTETSDAGYTQTFSGDCDADGAITLVAGDNKTCTITNNDIAPVIPPATITVVKTVVNDNEGVLTVSDFPLFVNGTPVVSGEINTFAAPASYTISETTDAGYTQTFSGDCDASGVVALVPGDNKTCTITNDDILPIVIPPAPDGTINVVKTIINDDGGTKVIEDFPLFVNDTLVISGETNTFDAPASYTISETTDPQYVQSFSGDCDADGVLPLSAGDTAFCIITNDDIAPVIPPATITVVKTVVNDDEGVLTISDFPLFVSGTPVVSAVANTFAAPASYTVTETTDAGYTQTFSGDCDASGVIALVPGDNKTCLITNDDIAPVIPPATITVVNVVLNDNEGVLTVSDFPLFVSGTPVVSAVANTFAAPASYTVTETTDAGYTQTFSGDCDASGVIALVPGVDAICVVTNNDIPLASIQVVKTVINDDGGVLTISDFPLFVNAAPVVSGVANTFAAPASYTISETTDAGYTQTFSGDCDASGMIALVPGDHVVCLVTNNDIAPVVIPPPPEARITVVKTVINDNGGTKSLSDFPLFVNGTPVVSGESTVFAAPLDYVVTETSDAGYTQTFSGDCDADGLIALVPGDDQVCTIVNDDIPPEVIPPASITVVRVVINDDEGALNAEDFTQFVDDAPVVSGDANVFAAPFSYVVTTTSDADYTQTFSVDCDADGNLDLSPGEDKICVITSNDIAAVVVDAEPEPEPDVVVDDVPAVVVDAEPEPDVVVLPVLPGGRPSSPRTVPPVPPIIDVVKVPSPLALPDGPGLVTYVYTVDNIGTVPMTDVTMVGDRCLPILFASGDDNADQILDVNETWSYSCTTTPPETQLNTIVATGWANGISTADVASSTIIVGVPIVPPLIHVTKVPSPLTLSAQGGSVLYTETITNPGTVALSNVRLSDDKCAPMEYISGDTNTDAKLDPTESWIYTCRTQLTKTTTNTGIASGEANGQTVRDLAIATVVVPSAPVVVPGFPNTGPTPLEGSSKKIFFLVGTLVVSIFLFAVRARKRGGCV